MWSRSEAFRSFSSRWSLMTCAKYDGVSTGIRFPPDGPTYLAAVYPVFLGDSGARLLKGPDPCPSFDPVLPMPLGLVKRPIGLGKELPLAPALPELSHPKAAGNPENCPIPAVERAFPQGGPDPLGKLSPALLAGPREEAAEPLPPPPPAHAGPAPGQ